MRVWHAAELAGPRWQLSTLPLTWDTPATWELPPVALCWVEAPPGPAVAEAEAVWPPEADEKAELARRLRPAGAHGSRDGVILGSRGLHARQG